MIRRLLPLLALVSLAQGAQAGELDWLAKATPVCSEGAVTTACKCGGAKVTSGYCYSGTAYSAAYWVDSVAGDDQGGTNGCTSAATPCATLGRLLAASTSANCFVGLKAGSYWREQLYVAGDTTWSGGLGNGCSVFSYGAGAKPILDAANVITAGSWTKTGGYTYVYQATLNTSIITGDYSGMGQRIWENWTNGANGRLTYVASQALVDSTPGSWTGPTRPTHGNDVIYVHASDDSDPATNGKVYEWPARPWGINAGHYPSSAYRLAVIDGVEIRRHGHHDGGLITASYVRNFVIDDGGWGPVDPLHSLWCNGICEDGTAAASISYGDDLPPVTLRRVTLDCALGKPPVAGVGQGSAVESHDSSGTGAHKHAKKTFDTVTVKNCGSAFSGGAATEIAIINANVADNSTEQFINHDYVDATYVAGGIFVRTTQVTATVGIASLHSAGTVSLCGYRSAKYHGAHMSLGATFTGSAVVYGSSFGFVSGATGPLRSGIGITAATATANVQRNLFYYVYQPISVNALPVATVDYDLYSNLSQDSTSWKVNGVESLSFASWQGKNCDGAGHNCDAAGFREAITLGGDLTLGTFLPSSTHAAIAGADSTYGDLATCTAAIP